jgi:hypothetical protein
MGGSVQAPCCVQMTGGRQTGIATTPLAQNKAAFSANTDQTLTQHGPVCVDQLKLPVASKCLVAGVV